MASRATEPDAFLTYLLALPRSVTSSSWRTLSRLKLLRKRFRGVEVRVHAPATEGSPQARQRWRPGQHSRRGWGPPRSRAPSIPMHRDCKLHPTLWTPPDDRFYLEVWCGTSQLPEFFNEAISLLGGEVPEQVWLVLRSGVVAWLDKYESGILGATQELGRVTCHHLQHLAVVRDIPRAFDLVIKEAPWDMMQPTLSITRLLQTGKLILGISLELSVQPLPVWDVEDVLLATWGSNQFQELEASHSVVFVTCTSRRGNDRPTEQSTRLGILARSQEHVIATEAALRQRCCVEDDVCGTVANRPQGASSPCGVSLAWYADWGVRPVEEDFLKRFFESKRPGELFGQLFTSDYVHPIDCLDFLRRWKVGLVTWRDCWEMLGTGHTIDTQDLHHIRFDLEDALFELAVPRDYETLRGIGDPIDWPPGANNDLLFICAKLEGSGSPSGSRAEYRFGVAGKADALPRFHEALVQFLFEKQVGRIDFEKSEKSELKRRVLQLEERLRTSEAELQRQTDNVRAMSWLFPAFPEVAEFGRSIPAVEPSDEARPLPVLALRFTHKAVNAHFAFGEEHENRQESIFKLFLGLFMGHLKPEELEPLYVFKHQGPDGTMGLYSRNNRRLVALLMFQAVRRDQLVRVPCRVLDSSDQRWEAPGGRRFDQWFHEGYDGGTGLSIHPRPGRLREAQHRGYPLFNPARTAIQALHRASSRANDKLAGDLAQMLLRHVHTRTGHGDEETLTFASGGED
ncbi:hypothetical protein AK812_SmicGene21905 [Symbiodinium microadriaticum]|uniref:Uncharacterized protein n=1 Tax=Symbiodinium microadriaticum TaxID=2951 RepID=A0A1Q9DL73_SYMMI|nr:hypothetical protein AK812_SmicGene21905 [Symbiodinium microadriaticum]